MHTFLRKIEAFIAQQQLLSTADAYLVALSGGADSVCLLRVLLSLGYHVEAAHCNFQLRGEESDRDETFCKTLCDHLGVPLHVAHFDTRAYAKSHKISIEMAAREQRYTYFEQLIRDRQLTAVLVAHHKNDAIETFLLNLARGTGIDGLKGIAAWNGLIRRPLLAVTRDEIIEYLQSFGQDYIFDSTNASLVAQRNIVRLKLMPILRELNPAVEENISRTLRFVSGSLDLLHTAVEEAKSRVMTLADSGIRISIPILLHEPAAEIILWEILKDLAFSSQQVEQIFANITAPTGTQWFSPTHTLLLNRDMILIEPINDIPDEELTIPDVGTYEYEGAEYTFEIQAVDPQFSPLKDPDSASLDAAAVAFPLTLRHIREGDSFVPYGMGGTRLLSDFLTDRKQSLFDKRRQVVLTDNTGHIVWVVGLRTDNRCAITAATTRALIIKTSR